MSNTISGKDGNIKTNPGGTELAQIQYFTIDEVVGINPSVTNRTGGNTQKNTGAKDWNGSMTYLYDRNIKIRVGVGDSLAVRCYRDQANFPDDWVSGTIVIRSQNIAFDISGADIGGSITFEGDGALTKNGIFSRDVAT